MKIVLLDKNYLMVFAWQKYFLNEKDVEIENDTVENYLSENSVNGIVTPGNSYGIMTGGFDLGVRNFFGVQLENRVKNYIDTNLNFKQRVGTSFIIEGRRKNIKVIYTPTMEEPSEIKDLNVIYVSTLSSLKLAKENNLNSLVLPAFGGATGKVNFFKIAELMYKAYKDFCLNEPKNKCKLN